MKIYNEIAIDMNPKSSSYGETLHEDSFEYNGDMMLMQAPTAGDTMSTSEGKIFKGYYKAPIHGNPGKLYKTSADASRDGLSPAEIRQLEKRFDYPVYTLNAIGGWDKTGSSNEPTGTHYEKLSMAPQGIVSGMEDVTEIDPETGEETPFAFTYKDGEFDPTSEEFKQYTETTGGYGAMASEGFGFEEGDFEEFYGKPLEFWKEEYDPEEGTLAAGRGLDLASIEETLRSAKAGYGLGMKAAGLQTGRNLFDIKQQTEQQVAKSGFATQGTVAGISRRAQKGVMADYNLQQQQLAEGLTGAKSAFDISQRRVGLAETQADIDYRRKQADFWKGTEDEFYDRLSFLESQG